MKRSGPIKRKAPIQNRSELKTKAPTNRKREKRSAPRRQAANDCRWRSPEYLAFVRTLPCCLCGAPANAAHHLIGMWGMSGMGLKAPDSMVMPVCDGPGDTCHRRIHDSAELRALQPGWMRQTIRAGLAEFGGDLETREALTHALVTIEARESA
tara:strand:- start:55731 stop:56192 length:462 start_codon:yes stop_codon:yes gene_type:complete